MCQDITTFFHSLDKTSWWTAVLSSQTIWFRFFLDQTSNSTSRVWKLRRLRQTKVMLVYETNKHKESHGRRTCIPWLPSPSRSLVWYTSTRRYHDLVWDELRKRRHLFDERNEHCANALLIWPLQPLASNDKWCCLLRENICYGCPAATDEQVHGAAANANALNFIQQLPDGFETQVKKQSLLFQLQASTILQIVLSLVLLEVWLRFKPL